MELTYENILDFMTEYFTVYSTYGQKLETAQRMHDFFLPDLRFIPYIAALGGPEGGFKSRDEFLTTAVRHTAWYEKLTPKDITIDERRNIAVVLFGMEVVDVEKEEVVVEKSAIAHYQLALDEFTRIADEFGAEIAVKTVREGGDYNMALKAHADCLAQENQALKARIAEFESGQGGTAAKVVAATDGGKGTFSDLFTPTR